MLSVALGAVLGESLMHKHKCPGCGLVWQHGDICKGDWGRAHTCARCGSVQHTIYFGEEPAALAHAGEIGALPRTRGTTPASVRPGARLSPHPEQISARLDLAGCAQHPKVERAGFEPASTNVSGINVRRVPLHHRPQVRSIR
jgi:hypothetical protein